MKPETEQLLGTLEILGSYNDFLWETEKQGEFNPWNLMKSQGFVKQTDLELVFEHWQNIENWGTPTDQKSDGYEYAPSRTHDEYNDRNDEDWNDEIAQQRQQYYQQLQKICQENLEIIEAYSLEVTNSEWEWERPYFYVSIIVGKTTNHNWICLAPIVEDLCLYDRNTSSYDQSSDNIQDDTLSNIESIVDRLTPITLYDYWYGGYNQTHQHQIVTGRGETKEEAISIALQNSGMLTWQLTQIEYADDYNHSQRLSQFMNQCLENRTQIKVSFWDIGYSYEVGCTPANDWIGIYSYAEFEYNP